MEWLPVENGAVASVADPPQTAEVPRSAAPSRNCTVPVAADGETVAVSVTDCPNADGLTEELTLTVAVALTTVCVHAAAVLPMKLPSPLYTAVIECVPTA